MAMFSAIDTTSTGDTGKGGFDKAAANFLIAESEINSKAASSHTHGTGGTVLTIVSNEAALGSGSSDGEEKICTDNGNRYTWDSDNSKWRVCDGNKYATASLPGASYTVATGTRVYDTTTNGWKRYGGSSWAADDLWSLLTTQGDTVYASAANTPARLAKGTALQTLQMNSGATAPEWGTSLASLLTTGGDIPYASAANTPARLAKGTARQALVMDASATGPAWAGCSTSTLTAQGDILYASAANTLARLAKGTAMQGLRINAAATAPEWGGVLGAGAYSLTDGATIAIDWNNGSTQYVTIAATGRTVTFANPVAGQVYRIIVIQDGSGSRTITTWPTIQWAGGSAPTLTTTASKADVVTLLYANSVYYGDCAKNF